MVRYMLDGYWWEHLPDHPVGLLEDLVLFEVCNSLLVPPFAALRVMRVLNVLGVAVRLLRYLERCHLIMRRYCGNHGCRLLGGTLWRHRRQLVTLSR